MRKIMFGLLAPVMAVSCGHFELYMPSAPSLGGSKDVLVGFFERRSLGFDPFVENNLRDSLAYELFKLGYRVRFVEPHAPDVKGAMKMLKKETIRDLCGHHGSVLFIQGAVSEREIGSFTDTEISTLVMFQIHDKDGEKIGEAYASTTVTLSDVSVMKTIVRRFAGRLNESLSDAP